MPIYASNCHRDPAESCSISPQTIRKTKNGIREYQPYSDPYLIIKRYSIENR